VLTKKGGSGWERRAKLLWSLESWLAEKGERVDYPEKNRVEEVGGCFGFSGRMSLAGGLGGHGRGGRRRSGGGVNK